MKLWLAVMALSAGIASSPVTLAHNHGKPADSAEPAAETMPSAAMPSDADVEQFAQSIMRVEKLKQQYQQELSQRPQAEVTDELLADVNARFEQEAVALIEQEGMSVEKYGTMVALLQQNPEFSAKVQQRVDELQ